MNKNISQYKKEKLMSNAKYICYVRLIGGMAEYYLTGNMSRREFITNLKQYYDEIEDVEDNTKAITGSL